MTMLWKGRLTGRVDERLNELNASLRFDSRMARQDILGSIAHATMLEKTGVLAPGEGEALAAALRTLLAELESGETRIDPNGGDEDIHTFVERVLTERLGDLGKKLHTGRSRNDQVALDLRLYLGEAIEALSALVCEVGEALCDVAQDHTHSVMPGYTHLQRAQPVTLAHHLMAYVWMLLRDAERLAECRKRTLVSPLGSGALAGTTYPLDRALVAELLHMNGITLNSLDGVSDRDFVLELSADLSLLMLHLSRMAEELTLWCSWEFRFMALSDSFSTGSSIMPQKKNPDIAELLRGKAARVCGDHVTLLTMLKALPLAYNKDLQEDKEAIFDAVDTARLCLSVLPPMLRTATFFPAHMRRAAAEGFINATDCADYLVKKGLPFRDAYKATGTLVNTCIEKGCTLETLPLEEYHAVCPLFDMDVYAAIDLMECVKQRKLPGGPAPEAVQSQIAAARERLQAAKAGL